MNLLTPADLQALLERPNGLGTCHHATAAAHQEVPASDPGSIASKSAAVLGMISCWTGAA